MVQIVPFEREDVSGFLHRPEGVASGGVVLTHGAGGNCNAPLLVAAAAAFSAAGVTALRVDLPFRQRRPMPPPAAPGCARPSLRCAPSSPARSPSAGNPTAGASRRCWPPTSPG